MLEIKKHLFDFDGEDFGRYIVVWTLYVGETAVRQRKRWICIRCSS